MLSTLLRTGEWIRQPIFFSKFWCKGCLPKYGQISASNKEKQPTELRPTEKFSSVKDQLGEQIKHSYIFNVIRIRWHGEPSKRN